MKDVPQPSSGEKTFQGPSIRNKNLNIPNREDISTSPQKATLGPYGGFSRRPGRDKWVDRGNSTDPVPQDDEFPNNPHDRVNQGTGGSTKHPGYPESFDWFKGTQEEGEPEEPAVFSSGNEQEQSLQDPQAELAKINHLLDEAKRVFQEALAKDNVLDEPETESSNEVIQREHLLLSEEQEVTLHALLNFITGTEKGSKTMDMTNAQYERFYSLYTIPVSDHMRLLARRLGFDPSVLAQEQLTAFRREHFVYDAPPIQRDITPEKIVTFLDIASDFYQSGLSQQKSSTEK